MVALRTPLCLVSDWFTELRFAMRDPEDPHTMGLSPNFWPLLHALPMNVPAPAPEGKSGGEGGDEVCAVPPELLTSWLLDNRDMLPDQAYLPPAPSSSDDDENGDSDEPPVSMFEAIAAFAYEALQMRLAASAPGTGAEKREPPVRTMEEDLRRLQGLFKTYEPVSDLREGRAVLHRAINERRWLTGSACHQRRNVWDSLDWKGLLERCTSELTQSETSQVDLGVGLQAVTGVDAQGLKYRHPTTEVSVVRTPACLTAPLNSSSLQFGRCLDQVAGLEAKFDGMALTVHDGHCLASPASTFFDRVDVELEGSSLRPRFAHAVRCVDRAEGS